MYEADARSGAAYRLRNGSDGTHSSFNRNRTKTDTGTGFRSRFEGAAGDHGSLPAASHRLGAAGTEKGGKGSDFSWYGSHDRSSPARNEGSRKRNQGGGDFPGHDHGRPHRDSHGHRRTGRDPHTWGSGSFRGSAGPDGRRRAGPEIREDQCLCQSIPGA